MKSIMKPIFYRILLLLLSSGIGVLLLCVVYFLPEENMISNARQSSQILTEEGVYPSKWGEEISSTLDNFTDALMIQNAIFPSTGNLLKDVIAVNHIQYTTMKPVEDLEAQVALKAGGYPQEYMRYWHGYLLFLKPLLLITDYQGIRLINFILQIFLIILLLYSMYHRGLCCFIPAFLLSWFSVAPWVIPYSMQLSVMYYLSISGSIFLLLFYHKIQQHPSLYFMLLGILTSYFDYLTYPLLSLGLPLIFYLLMENQEKKTNIKPLFIHVLSICINWGLGYGGMWAAKWILSEFLLQNGALSQALGAALYRSSTESEGAGVLVTPLLIWIENIKRLFNPAFCMGIFLFILAMVTDLGYRIHKKQLKIHYIPAIPFLLTASLPFVWYALLKNHSFVHLSLVYRSLWITIFSGMCFLITLFKTSSVLKKNSNNKSKKHSSIRYR